MLLPEPNDVAAHHPRIICDEPVLPRFALLVPMVLQLAHNDLAYFPGPYGSYPGLSRSAHERTQPPALSPSASFGRSVPWRLGTVSAGFYLFDGTENLPAVSEHSPYHGTYVPVRCARRARRREARRRRQEESLSEREIV